MIAIYVAVGVFSANMLFLAFALWRAAQWADSQPDEGDDE